MYVPLTMDRLAEAVAGGALPPGPAYAVTAGLREWYAEGGAEELEEAARDRAVQASLRLAAAESASRRVVVAADTEALRVEPGVEEPGLLALTAPVPREVWAAVLADEAAAAPALAAAAAALPASDAGDLEALLVVDAVEDHELLWWGVQELEQLLAEAGG